LFSSFPRRLNRALRPMIEKLECRQLLAGDGVTAFALPITRDFSKPSGGVVDSAGRGTGFTFVQANETSTEYRKGLIYLRPGASLLRVKSRGDNFGNDNSLVNGLMTTFSAANTWSATATLKGPFSLKNGQGAGIMFGPDINNFVRLALVNRSGTVGLEFVDEQKIKSGFRRQLPSAVTPIGTISSIGSLELSITGNSVTGRLTAYFRINGGSLQQLPTSVRLRTDKRKFFFSTKSHAGIAVFNSPTAGTTTAVYDKFSIAAGAPGAGTNPAGPNTTPLAINTTTRYFNDVRGGGSSETKTISITNPNSSAVTISSIALSGTDSSQFFLSGANGSSHSIGAGATESFTVAMGAGSSTTLGIKSAGIVITTATGSATVPIRGLATSGQGGTNEPSLQRVFDLYQIATQTGDPTPATYDLPASATSSDEVNLQRMVKAGSGSVTIEPLAVFGVGASNAPTVNFGWYASGNKDDKSQLLTLTGTGQTTQTVNPGLTGSTSFDPGTASFSFYMLFPSMYPAVVQTPGGTSAYGEDTFNTYDPNTKRKIRAYRLRGSDGSVVPNAFIIAGEDLNAGYDTQDFVAIVRNVSPVTSGAEVGFSNPEGPFDNRIVFNRIQTPDAVHPNQVHDTATFSVLNTGSQTLNVSGYDLSNSWQVLNGPAANAAFTVAPGGSQTFTVKFNYAGPGGSAVNQMTFGHMRFTTNDPDEAQANVELAGFWQTQSENQTEPTLAQVIQMAGYTTAITNSGQNINGGGQVLAVGDEVLSNYWTRADASSPVTVTQLGQWHTQGNTAAFNWLDQGSSTKNTLFVADGADAQSFLPDKNGTSTLASGSFTPAGNFYIKVDDESSVDSQNVQEQGGGGWGHHLRFYPAKDRDGKVIPNTYIVTMDYQGINYDYNDNTYIVTNIKPA
jgi:hypothetical protein